MEALSQYLLPLEPQYKERVWGGQRLRASHPPVGEAWVSYGSSVVSSGRMAGRSIDDLVSQSSAELLGNDVFRHYGQRFPLLVKLLDCADWLSVQVHPTDEQARRMAGPDQLGKTEAWYFLDSEAHARILAGVKPGVREDALADAIRRGSILDLATYVEVHSGEALLMPAGMLHALGPGLLLYEIQQSSDITYRAYDWDRPLTNGRQLHIEESVEVMRPIQASPCTRPEIATPTGSARAVSCPYFNLDLVRVSSGRPLAGTTAGRTFHILTVVGGRAQVTRGKEQIELGRFETAVVAGAAGEYEVRAIEPSAAILRAAVPE